MDSSSWWTAPCCCIKFSKTQSTIGRVTSSENGPQMLELSISSCAGSNLCSFTLKELSMVTGEFSQNNLIGEGGFGPVYRGFINGTLRSGIESQPVAVKLLNLDGSQGNKEWLSEVMFLGKLRHPHLARLIGYCYENEHRLLVYEYMPNGSLENHLFQRIITSLPWSTRLKILVGAAKGLAFLHGAEKPVIYRDFKASNILLDSDFTAKLSDFGFAKDGPVGDNTHISTRVMGTEGYTAPEYIMTGHLTVKSDVYSFGVVLLELLTGRRSVDRKRRSREQNLVEWARPSLNDAMKLSRIMDPSLNGIYSTAAAQRAAAMAYQCLSQSPKTRPHMSSIVDILESLVNLNDGMPGSFVFTVITENSAREENERGNANNNKDGGITRRYNFMRMR